MAREARRTWWRKKYFWGTGQVWHDCVTLETGGILEKTGGGQEGAFWVLLESTWAETPYSQRGIYYLSLTPVNLWLLLVLRLQSTAQNQQWLPPFTLLFVYLPIISFSFASMRFAFFKYLCLVKTSSSPGDKTPLRLVVTYWRASEAKSSSPCTL